MATTRELLAIKGSRVACTQPHATAYEAAAQMSRDGIGSLLVLDTEGQLLGIVTERDILSRVVAQHRDADLTRVDEVMTSELVCGRLHTTIEEARLVMKDRRIRHLPILDDNDELLGLVSIGDLNAFEASSQEQTIYLLQEYITGRV